MKFRIFYGLCVLFLLLTRGSIKEREMGWSCSMPRFNKNWIHYIRTEKREMTLNMRYCCYSEP
jgi:hypothetical protein